MKESIILPTSKVLALYLYICFFIRLHNDKAVSFKYLLGSLKQKPRSVNRKISSLKSFTKYCLKEHYLTNDFTHGIESPKTDDKLPILYDINGFKAAIWLFRTRPITFFDAE